jgi:beta-glucosidase
MRSDLYPQASVSNALQKAIMERGPKVPVLFLEECLHGYQQSGHTVFPSPLTMAASWDRYLLHAFGRATATEARSVGVAQCLSPVLGVARELRWGRIEELFGEDTYLNGEYAYAVVTGLQDYGHLSNHDAVIAEPKRTFDISNRPLQAHRYDA